MQGLTTLRTLLEHGVDFVVCGFSAAHVYGVEVDRPELELCFRQTWDNCEALTFALEEMGADVEPPLPVPIPPTEDLRKAKEPLRFRDREGVFYLAPEVAGLGPYDDLLLATTLREVGGLELRMLTIQQLITWIHARADQGDHEPMRLLDALWRL